MFSILQNALSFTTKRAPILELFLEDECSYVDVIGWGEIEALRLLPFDRLILHKCTEIGVFPEYESGELLVLKPRGWGRLALGRKYGEHILIEPFGKPISLEHWGIVGAVLAIERPLGMGSSLSTPAHVALYNAPKEYDQHIVVDYVCDSVYIADLSSRLFEEAPESSCVVAGCTSLLDALLAQVPSGKLWISPTTQESVSEHCQEWQIVSKREQRKNWRIRHMPIQIFNAPLPNFENNTQEDAMPEICACK